QGWGASVNLMLFDTRRFGGEQAFLQETTFLADACRRNPPRPGVDAVRMPGDRGLQNRIEQLENGVALHPTIAPALAPCATSYGLVFPEPIKT
ncbi:MAG: Ldh family oxidoreductase, partial [Pigmentiphaga sp.]